VGGRTRKIGGQVHKIDGRQPEDADELDAQITYERVVFVLIRPP
jgi:hypothetical protein